MAFLLTQKEAFVFIDESRTASKYTNGASVGRGNPAEIVIHHWGVDGQSHDGVVSFFERQSTGTSAHFVVSDGRIHCLVSTTDVAWHAGDWAVNLRSIGIECRPEATDGDYAAVAWLIGWLRERFGNIPLRPHQKYAQTACPGRYDLARLDREAAGVKVAVKAETITTITPAEQPKEDTLSAAEVKEIKQAIGSMESGIRSYIADHMLHGTTSAGTWRPGATQVVIENQRRINTANAKLAALEALVSQLAKGQGVDVDYAKIEEAIKKALTDGIEVSGTIAAKGASK